MMNLTSVVIVSFFLMDFAPQLLPAAPAANTSYTSSGNGTLTVSVDEMPVLGSVPQGALRIPFMTLNLSASCESDIKIQSLSVRHTGLGQASDISAVYAVSGYRRVSRAARFDNIRATLRFMTPFVVPKCSALQLQILGDMSQTATVAAEHGLAFIDAAPVQSSAKQVTVTTMDSTIRVLATPTNGGTITVRLLPISSRLSYGHIQTVARLQLTADSRSAHLLKSVEFTNTETARDMDLQWMQLETPSGKVLSPPLPRMHAYKAKLLFDPTYILSAGETIVLNLKAEVRGGQSKKVDFEIEEPSDLETLPYRER